MVLLALSFNSYTLGVAFVDAGTFRSATNLFFFIVTTVVFVITIDDTILGFALVEDAVVFQRETIVFTVGVLFFAHVVHDAVAILPRLLATRLANFRIVIPADRGFRRGRGGRGRDIDGGRGGRVR